MLEIDVHERIVLCIEEGKKQGIIKTSEYKELLGYIDKWFAEVEKRLTDGSRMPNDLEEAAGEYAGKHGFRVPYDGSDKFYDDVDVKASKEGFIAGAKWQEEKEKEYSPWLVIPKLKEAALEFGEQAKDYEIGGQSFAEDMAIAFTRGAEWQKEQMMKDAVEGEVCIPNVWVEHKEGKELVVRAEISKELGFKFGDKVRIIIVKED